MAAPVVQAVLEALAMGVGGVHAHEVRHVLAEVLHPCPSAQLPASFSCRHAQNRGPGGKPANCQKRMLRAAVSVCSG